MVDQFFNIKSKGDSFLYMVKSVSKSIAHCKIEVLDVIGDYFALAFYKVGSKGIYFYKGNKTIKLDKGEYIVFFPPHSICEYYTENENLDVEMIIISPDSISELSSVFPLDVLDRLSTNDILAFSYPEIVCTKGDKLFIIDINKGIEISRLKKEAETASRIRDAIINELSGNMSTISKKLQISPSLLSKTFSRHYHISPKIYSQRIRAFNAAIELIKTPPQKKKISTIAIDKGFNDISRFNKNFKKIAGFTPSFFKNL